MSFLLSLVLSNNLLVGSLPAVLFNFSALHELFPDTNCFSGTIPSVTAAVDGHALLSLALDYNHLTGTILPSLSYFVNLQGLALLQLSHWLHN